MIQIVPKTNLTIQDIKKLRTLCNCSISELKSASKNREVIQEYLIFEGQWAETRNKLKELADDWQKADLPFSIYLSDEQARDEFEDVASFTSYLKHLRQIEVEQQMATDLEQGYINSRDEFIEHDEDWT
ncbi:MAG: hypothetical protein COA78_14455 [Blastopirellula sp.]|nr:MAG: hypothetical protein COA78_14455 [Blastopirellula sp.]